MNAENFNKMLNMLIQATKEKKIEWQEITMHAPGFLTEVGGCQVKILSDYDLQLEESSYVISLLNPDGRVFSTISYSESDDSVEYKIVDELYNTIRDVMYRISESEDLILNSLQKLTGIDKR